MTRPSPDTLVAVVDSPAVCEPRDTSPYWADQRNAQVAEDPTIQLSPTTVLPSAETAWASFPFVPGRRPRPVKLAPLWVGGTAITGARAGELGNSTDAERAAIASQ